MDNTTILIVEDENIVALDLQQRLLNLGYRVAGRATMAIEAIEKAAESRPNLVLMDIRLKGNLDGISAADQIRSRFDIPVIFLTAYSDETTFERAKLTEPHGYLLKPFEDNDLHTTIQMALYRHRVERELKESRQWLATTLKSIGDAVIATDNQGNIKFMNSIAEALTGWTQAEVMGNPSTAVFKIINGKTRQPTPSPVLAVLETGLAVELEDNTLLVSRVGLEIPVDDSAAPILDERGQFYGVVLVFRDITARRNTEEKLRQFMVELQSHNAELDAFAHTVAHDLKTPLNPIIGFAEFLTGSEAPELNPELAGHLNLIARSGRKMINVIDELLLMAQLRSADANWEVLDMAQIVREAQMRLDFSIQETQAEIILPQTWPECMGYGPWVEEIWVNYFSNAIKYGGTPPRLELGAATQPNGMVRYWVKDNGPGLTPADQAKLFRPFIQLKLIRARGHGLGLSIVNQIVNKLNGAAGVESAGIDGQGCTFFFTLPGVSKNGHSGPCRRTDLVSTCSEVA
jgi:hypothetical protein